MRGGVHACSIWLIHGQRLSDDNLAILAEAAILLCTLSGPWVIGGDWNITPETLQASGWLDVVGGKVVAPTLATCTYDFS